MEVFKLPTFNWNEPSFMLDLPSKKELLKKLMAMITLTNIFHLAFFSNFLEFLTQSQANRNIKYFQTYTSIFLKYIHFSSLDRLIAYNPKKNENRPRRKRVSYN